MNCEEWIERLYQILDRDMDNNFCHDLEEHMKFCRACLDRFEFEKELKSRVRNPAASNPAPKLSASASRPSSKSFS